MVDQTASLLQSLAKREICIIINYPFEKEIKSPYLKLKENLSLTFIVPKNFELNNLLSSLDLSLDMIRDISIREGNLEDVFQTLTRDEK